MKLLVCLCLISLGAHYCFEEDDFKLELVQAYFRHGSRTPSELELYPTSPYQHTHFKNIGFYQLTKPGKEMMYDLGKALKARYESFLIAENPNDIVLCRTTDLDRTKISALLVLAGLFPPQPADRLEPNLNWTPIPYHYKMWKHDWEFNFAQIYCPNYARAYEAVFESNLMNEFINRNKHTFDYIQEHAGKKMSKILDVFFMHHGFKAVTAMNLTLPEWTRQIYPNSSHHIGLHLLKFESHDTILKRLNGGRAMKTVIENMLSYTNNASKINRKRIYLNSVHDNNIAAMLSVLDLLESMPKFGSTLLFELYSSKARGDMVKVLYMKDPYSTPEEMHVASCGTVCSLEQFVNVTKPYIPLDIEAECNNSSMLVL